MGKKIALGQSTEAPATVIAAIPLSLEEKVVLLTKQVEELTKAFHIVNNIRLKDKRQQEIHDELGAKNINIDKIPIGLSLIGISVLEGIHILTVTADGYYIGETKYNSLSAAAEAVSHVKIDGWIYWKLPDGRTAKEAFRKD